MGSLPTCEMQMVISLHGPMNMNLKRGDRGGKSAREETILGFANNKIGDAFKDLHRRKGYSAERSG